MYDQPGDLAVDVRGLYKTFGQRRKAKRDDVIVRALDGVDLQIAHGERVAIVGINGSGKSTLIRVLATLTTPDVQACSAGMWNAKRIWCEGTSTAFRSRLRSSKC